MTAILGNEFHLSQKLSLEIQENELLFLNINQPTPSEIREWMKLNNLNIRNASDALGISKRQFSRILSGESKAKRLHALAMQMVWLINENKKKNN